MFYTLDANKIVDSVEVMETIGRDLRKRFAIPGKSGDKYGHSMVIKVTRNRFTITGKSGDMKGDQPHFTGIRSRALRSISRKSKDYGIRRQSSRTKFLKKKPLYFLSKMNHIVLPDTDLLKVGRALSKITKSSKGRHDLHLEDHKEAPKKKKKHQPDIDPEEIPKPKRKKKSAKDPEEIPKPKRKKKSAKEPAVEVYQVTCGRKYFPLLDYHCSLANDIDCKFKKVKHLISSKRKDAEPLPRIAHSRSEELMFTVVTNGKISEDLPLLVRKQNMDSVTFNKIAEKQDVSCLVHEAKSSICCIVFEHSNVNLHVQAHTILRVSSKARKVVPCQNIGREMESDMTEQSIRNSLTHFLGEPLFAYAENVAERLAYAQNDDELIGHAIQAAHALLNRKSRSAKSSEPCKIPNDLNMELKTLATDGVLAFGFLFNDFVVFVDENISVPSRRKSLRKKVNSACSKLDKLPRIEFISRSFLKPSSLKPGDKLKNRAKSRVGTLGMITRAKDKRMRNNEKTIVAALTSGHYFEEEDIAVGYEDEQNETETELGRCIACLTESTDVAVVKIKDSDRFLLNFYDENERLCDCIPMKQDMQIHDLVYKRGMVTGLTKGYIRSPDFRINHSEDTAPLCNVEEGYLIEGDGNEAFAEEGDSGSVVFFPDLEDGERETVQIVSIQSLSFDEAKARALEIPSNISYTVRADKCFEKLRDEKKIEIHLPARKDMN